MKVSQSKIVGGNSMTWSIHIRHLSMWMIALALLMLMISLAACTSNGINQGTPVVQTTQSAQPQQGAPTSTSASQSVSSRSQPSVQSNTTSTGTTTGLQNTDQQIQKTLQSLDNAQNDVNTSSSVQENDPQP